MKQFSFKLSALLRYRAHQRDLCRQLLATILADDAKAIREKKENESQQHSLLNEIETKSGVGTISVAEISSRRFYISQLKASVLQIEERRLSIAKQIDQCRSALVLADQAVKALENLESKQKKQHEEIAQKRADLVAEEAWNAAHYGKGA